MSLIARLTGDSAPARAARVEEKAHAAGFEDVQVTYRPQSRAFEVSGILPDSEAQRTVDRILGR